MCDNVTQHTLHYVTSSIHTCYTLRPSNYHGSTTPRVTWYVNI